MDFLKNFCYNIYRKTKGEINKMARCRASFLKNKASSYRRKATYKATQALYHAMGGTGSSPNRKSKKD